MNEISRADADEELHRVLHLNERSLDVAQQVSAVLGETARELRRLLERARLLDELAWSDHLTDLLNRRGLDDQMKREEARAARYGMPCAVVLLDVVGLKAVNDRHGHVAGDAVLRAVAAGLRTAARGSDVLARYGGDEFLALLPGADLAGGEKFVRRVRSAAPFARLSDDTAVPVLLAAGIAEREEEGSLAGALGLADQRLIVDKQRRHT